MNNFVQIKKCKRNRSRSQLITCLRFLHDSTRSWLIPYLLWHIPILIPHPLILLISKIVKLSLQVAIVYVLCFFYSSWSIFQLIPESGFNLYQRTTSPMKDNLHKTITVTIIEAVVCFNLIASSCCALTSSWHPQFPRGYFSVSGKGVLATSGIHLKGQRCDVQLHEVVSQQIATRTSDVL